MIRFKPIGPVFKPGLINTVKGKKVFGVAHKFLGHSFNLRNGEFPLKPVSLEPCEKTSNGNGAIRLLQGKVEAGWAIAEGNSIYLFNLAGFPVAKLDEKTLRYDQANGRVIYGNNLSDCGIKFIDAEGVAVEAENYPRMPWGNNNKNAIVTGENEYARIIELITMLPIKIGVHHFGLDNNSTSIFSGKKEKRLILSTLLPDQSPKYRKPKVCELVDIVDEKGVVVGRASARDDEIQLSSLYSTETVAEIKGFIGEEEFYENGIILKDASGKKGSTRRGPKSNISLTFLNDDIE